VAEKEEIVDKAPEQTERAAETEQLEVAAAAGEAVAGETEAKEIDELAQVRAEAADMKDKWMRLAAEFENYKRRMERDRGLAMKYREEQVLKELLPCIDNLERAIEQGRKTDNAADLLAGVELTYKGLLAALERFELVPMQSVGSPFDPNIHEALAMEETGEVEPNCVVREFEKGYMYKDRLIRPAKVVVAKRTETAGDGRC
jgi:molecular chaperone GrpE